MRLRGGQIVAKALEDEGVRFAFGIPGTHNTELYDALERSSVTPVLVTDEQCASFMADAVSRTSATVGVANVVPGAGVTHCLSGVAEAFMDNVPLVVLTCGIRRDTGKSYQLHDIDQLAILKPITKGTFKPDRPEDIYPMIRRAFALARSGTPGPVAVEIAAEFYLLVQDVPVLEFEEKPVLPPPPAEADLKAAAELLNNAHLPVLYAGNGAKGASALLKELAEKLGSPVATTVQGKGVFPESHPLWLWNGLGASTPPFVRKALEGCDVMLAVGCRFGEVATASYGFAPPSALIHVDINKDVFNRNYRASVAIEADAAVFIRALLPLIKPRHIPEGLENMIASGHLAVREQWRKEKSADKVTPAVLYETLMRLAPKAIYATDSGNGTFLSMEHLRLDEPGRFIGPIDYSCMGYATPGAIGAKFANPDKDVVALAGDGALLMTGLELLTAAHMQVAPVIAVLRDGELSQIAQFQRTALNRDTCSILHPFSLEAFAKAVNCEFVLAETDKDVEGALTRAFELSRKGRPVVADIRIDYGRKTYFTKGVVTTNFWRLPLRDRFSMLLRAAGRRLASLVGAGAPAA